MHDASTNRQKLFQYLKKHITDDWFSKNYGGVIFPIFLQGYFAVVRGNQQSPFAMAHGLAFQNWQNEREFDWRWNVNEMLETRLKLFSALEKNNTFGKKFFNDYLHAWCCFDLATKNEEKIDYKKLSALELVERLLNLIETAGQQGFGYVIDSLLSTSSDDWFKNQLTKYLGYELSAEKLNILREPTHRTFINEAHLEMLQIACFKLRNLPIDKHLQKLPSKIKAKDRLLKKIKNAELVDLLKISDAIFVIHDRRKEHMTQVITYLELILKEIARRFDLLLTDLNYIRASELEQLPRIWPELKRRRAESVYILFPEGENPVLTGVKAKTYFSKLERGVDRAEISEIKGNSASPGKVTGVVKICRGEKELGKMQEGDILVACMTQPEFLPALKKAKAVITDEGGLTCHTAIVTRELGIPAVIGTKIATKVLKDGDLVEVDANRGIIKIIKRT